MYHEKYLVTDGFGFIGSNTCMELINNNYQIVVVDNFMNSSKKVISKLEKLTKRNIKYYEIDLCNKVQLETIFQKNKIDAVIHFAGLKAVGESVKKPILYYQNNIVSTLNLLEIMEEHQCYQLVFSSFATFYGDAKSPLTESDEIGFGVTNPYGQTKFIS